MTGNPLRNPVTWLVAVVGAAVVGIAAALTAGDDDGDDQVSYCAIPAAERGPYDPDAPPYPGTGLHEVAVLLTDTTAELGDPTAGLPAEWLADTAGSAELVVCETGYGDQPRETCYLGGWEHSLEVRRHRFHVIEAATGREVGRFTVDSDRTCPDSVSRRSTGTRFPPGPVDPAALRQELRPYVVGGS